jgi:hypothetical protein
MSLADDGLRGAEIKLRDARIIEQVAAATFVTVLAKVKHLAAVRESERSPRILLDHKDSDPLAVDGANLREHSVNQHGR